MKSDQALSHVFKSPNESSWQIDDYSRFCKKGVACIFRVFKGMASQIFPGLRPTLFKILLRLWLDLLKILAGKDGETKLSIHHSKLRWANFVAKITHLLGPVYMRKNTSPARPGAER